MFCKAILICEDVRVEATGTLTLIGVHSERLRAPPGSGPMRTRIRFLTVVGGLRGAERLKYRHQLREMRERERFDLPFDEEAHDPAADEHNFVFGDELVFPGEGEYEVITDVEAGGQRKSFRYQFQVVRGARP